MILMYSEYPANLIATGEGLSTPLNRANMLLETNANFAADHFRGDTEGEVCSAWEGNLDANIGVRSRTYG